VSHFSCIGYGAESEDAFEELVAELVEQAREVPFGARSHHALVSDESGARLAMHFEGSTIACITPWFEAGARFKVRTGAPLDDEHCVHCGGTDCDFLDDKGEVVTRATVQLVWALPWFPWLRSERTFTLQLAAFAHKVTAFADEAGFAAGQPGELKLASNAFLPYGMFDQGKSVTRRASALFAGRIVDASTRTNVRTGRTFHHLRIDTLPGVLDVVADAVEGEPRPGTLALVEAWLVGTPSDPSRPPEPEPQTAKILQFTRPK
jgi:hypothetical protein